MLASDFFIGVNIFLIVRQDKENENNLLSSEYFLLTLSNDKKTKHWKNEIIQAMI